MTRAELRHRHQVTSLRFLPLPARPEVDQCERLLPGNTPSKDDSRDVCFVCCLTNVNEQHEQKNMY